MEEHALEGLLLLPASARGLYYGKAIANWAQLALLGAALVPVMVVLYDAGTVRLVSLLGVILLGTAGLSAPGTLYAAMTAQARARQTLLPLLLFPLVVPVLLAAVKATSLLILGDPMGPAPAMGVSADRLRRYTLVARRIAFRPGRGGLMTAQWDNRLEAAMETGVILSLLLSASMPSVSSSYGPASSRPGPAWRRCPCAARSRLLYRRASR
jgi:hypothetical protein